jgi:hypothetical protein
MAARWAPSPTTRSASRNNAVGEVLHDIRRRPKIIIAVLGAVGLTAAVVFVIAANRGSGPAQVPQVVVIDPSNGTSAAPAEFDEFAASVYEGQRAYCHQRWSALLFEAGEPSSTPFSRTALRATAAKLPGAKRFMDGLLVSIATNGCVSGFLELLEEDRAYALS